MIALQGETPAALAGKVDLLDEAEARHVVAAVHRDESIGNPVRGVRRVALDAVRAVAHVPSLTLLGQQARPVWQHRHWKLKTKESWSSDSADAVFPL